MKGQLYLDGQPLCEVNVAVHPDHSGAHPALPLARDMVLRIPDEPPQPTPEQKDWLQRMGAVAMILVQLSRDARVRWPVAIDEHHGRGPLGAFMVQQLAVPHLIHIGFAAHGDELLNNARAGVGCQLCGTAWHEIVGDDPEHRFQCGIKQPPTRSESYRVYTVCQACCEWLSAAEQEYAEERDHLRSALAIVEFKRQQNAHKPQLKVPE